MCIPDHSSFSHIPKDKPALPFTGSDPQLALHVGWVTKAAGKLTLQLFLLFVSWASQPRSALGKAAFLRLSTRMIFLSFLAFSLGSFGYISKSCTFLTNPPCQPWNFTVLQRNSVHTNTMLHTQYSFAKKHSLLWLHTHTHTYVKLGIRYFCMTQTQEQQMY